MAPRAWPSFASAGYLPEALVNYLALLGWSPGENEEIAARCRDGAPLRCLAKVEPQRGGVRHGQAGLDEPALHEGGRPAQARRARRCRTFVRAGYRDCRGRSYHVEFVAIAAADGCRVGRPARGNPGACRGRCSTGTWPGPRRSCSAEADGARAVAAFAEAVGIVGAARSRLVSRRCGRKRGKRPASRASALFHPIRVALTAADSGPELDLAVPAIDRGAALGSASGLAPIRSCSRAAPSVARAA